MKIKYGQTEANFWLSFFRVRSFKMVKVPREKNNRKNKNPQKIKCETKEKHQKHQERRVNKERRKQKRKKKQKKARRKNEETKKADLGGVEMPSSASQPEWLKKAKPYL